MLVTIDRTIRHMKGELEMDEREFFTGLEDERIGGTIIRTFRTRSPACTGG